MKPRLILLVAIVCLITTCTFVNAPILLALSLVSIVVYAEVLMAQTKNEARDAEKELNDKINESGKALSDALKISFDHIKKLSNQQGQLGAKVRDQESKLHRADMTKHKVDALRSKEQALKNTKQNER